MSRPVGSTSIRFIASALSLVETSSVYKHQRLGDGYEEHADQGGEVGRRQSGQEGPSR